MLPGKISTEPKSKPEEVVKKTKTQKPPVLTDKKPVKDQKTEKPESIGPLTENKPGPSVEGIKDKRFFQIMRVRKRT